MNTVAALIAYTCLNKKPSLKHKKLQVKDCQVPMICNFSEYLSNSRYSTNANISENPQNKSLTNTSRYPWLSVKLKTDSRRLTTILKVYQCIAGLHLLGAVAHLYRLSEAYQQVPVSNGQHPLLDRSSRPFSSVCRWYWSAGEKPMME